MYFERLGHYDRWNTHILISLGNLGFHMLEVLLAFFKGEEGGMEEREEKEWFISEA